VSAGFGRYSVERSDWIPEGVPLEKPSVARMYDYHLGGAHNFAADRAAAEAAAAAYPDLPLVMRVNRAFLRRAVTFLAQQGIDQFLDLGSGIPTVGNVHEVAERANPAARVVYVDVDPVAVAHSKMILRGNPRVTVIREDLRDLDRILQDPETRRVLDFNRPLAVLLVFVLHFVPSDTEAIGVTQAVREMIPSGSYVVISHGTAEQLAPEVQEHETRLSRQTTHTLKLRSRDQIAAFFEGLELVPPGLVYLPEWHPEGADDLFVDQPQRSSSYGGIGRRV
jgi:S-adenosyl methyltransferase